jgi:hypothetical protein
MAERRAPWLWIPFALAIFASWAALDLPAHGQSRPRPRVGVGQDAAIADAGPDASATFSSDGAVLSVPTLPTPDAALPEDPEARRERAASEFTAGMNDYRRGDFASAATHFQAAYDALPDPAPLFNLARSWEGANEITRALDAYQRYLAAAPGAQDRDEVVARIALLRQRPVEVFVATQPPGAFVFIDGSSDPVWGTTPVVLRLQPGRHTVALVRDGYSRLERPVEVRAGERQTLTFALLADDPNSTPTAGRWQDPVILDRRVAVQWATRFAGLFGAARTFENNPFWFSFGADFTLFYRRNFMANARFLRVEPDGAWTLATLGAGYVLPIEDLDLAFVGHLGVAHGYHQPDGARLGLVRSWDAVVGAEARLDWYFHRRLSLGLFVRGDLLTDFTPVVRFQTNLGVAIGLTP